jgi:hypothetical protein
LKFRARRFLIGAMYSLPRTAWEPVTPRGVAAFARASNGRLFLVQLMVALIVAATVVWFIYDAWFPTVRAAIKQLPEAGEIRSGKMNWRGTSLQRLTEGTFLAFTVDLDHTGEARSAAHVEVEFGRESFFIRSLFGYTEAHYPKGWIIAFNRIELTPWFGAWQPWLLVFTALATIVSLFVSWIVLATLYTLPVWLLLFYVDRDLKLRECWRMAGAALMPGALMMAVGILLYDFAVVDLVGLAFIAGGHLVLSWIYLFVAPLFLPRVAPGKKSRNPFTGR